ncbi:hypothetical protein [Kitasatospora sp. NPDC088548]|uniref:hypothetical protein n=1 Tax=Kitasatospora sp. NPDC088548 TaxID=3364075 RepID=UPI0038309247
MNSEMPPEPAWNSPEYRTIALERVATSIPAGDNGAAAFLSATVAFFGDGDTVRETEVFQKAAEYFRAHPELTVHAANWTRTTDGGSELLRLEVSVTPPEWIPPNDVPRLYPWAGR